MILSVVSATQFSSLSFQQFPNIAKCLNFVFGYFAVDSGISTRGDIDLSSISYRLLLMYRRIVVSLHYLSIPA